MTYLLLMIEDPHQRDERTEAEGQDVYGRMVEWGDDLRARGLLKASESLASTRDGARVRRRDGRPMVVDGPFTEAKEMVGGFFLIAVETLDEAVAIAGKCPASEWCTVEVRKVGPCFG